MPDVKVVLIHLVSIRENSVLNIEGLNYFNCFKGYFTTRWLSIFRGEKVFWLYKQRLNSVQEYHHDFEYHATYKQRQENLIEVTYQSHWSPLKGTAKTNEEKWNSTPIEHLKTCSSSDPFQVQIKSLRILIYRYLVELSISL